MRPMTSKQAKKAYAKRGGVPQLTELEKRQIARRTELDERREQLREKEERRKENARKKEIKDAKQREARAQQGLPEIPEPKVNASQPRIRTFFANYGARVKEAKEARDLAEAEEEMEREAVLEVTSSGSGGAGAKHALGAEDGDGDAVARATRISRPSSVSTEVKSDGFGQPRHSQHFEQQTDDASLEPRRAWRKRTFSSQDGPAATLPSRRPCEVDDPLVSVIRSDIWVPPSQTLLANKRPRSAESSRGRVDRLSATSIDIAAWHDDFMQAMANADARRSVSREAEIKRQNGHRRKKDTADIISDSRASGLSRKESANMRFSPPRALISSPRPFNEATNPATVAREEADTNTPVALISEDPGLGIKPTSFPKTEFEHGKAVPGIVNGRIMTVSFNSRFGDMFANDSELELTQEFEPQPLQQQQPEHVTADRTEQSPIQENREETRSLDEASVTPEFAPTPTNDTDLDEDLADLFPNDSQVLIGQSSAQPGLSAVEDTLPVLPCPSRKQSTQIPASSPRTEDLLAAMTVSQLAELDHGQKQRPSQDRLVSEISASTKIPVSDPLVNKAIDLKPPDTASNLDLDLFEDDDFTASEAAALEKSVALLLPRVPTSVARGKAETRAGAADNTITEPPSDYGDLDLGSEDLRELGI